MSECILRYKYIKFGTRELSRPSMLKKIVFVLQKIGKRKKEGHNTLPKLCVCVCVCE